MRTLQSRHFVATPADVKELAVQYRDSREVDSECRGTYFKMLVATTQAELQLPIRQRAPRNAAKGKVDTRAQLKALRVVHGRFYPVVKHVLFTPDILPTSHMTPEERRRRMLERNSRTNFARSAMSTVRRWLLSGHDIRTLVAARTSKHQLAGATTDKRTRPPKALQLQRQTQRTLTTLEGLTTAWGRIDKEAARAALQAGLTRIATALGKLSGAATRDAQKAVEEHRPLRVQGSTFWPVEQHEIQAVQ